MGPLNDYTIGVRVRVRVRVRSRSTSAEHHTPRVRVDERKCFN